MARDLRSHREPWADLDCYLVAAIIGGVATTVGTIATTSATSKASKAATQAADKNTALQGQIYDQNKALVQPTVDQGAAAATTENALLGLSGDPAAAGKAFDTYRGSTGYQFQLNQGVNAITGSQATRGMLDSGATLKALDAYGQGVAGQSFGDYFSRVDSIANRGVNAIGAITGAGQTYANAVTANNNNAAGAIGNAALAGANAINSGLSSLTSAYGLYRGQSSYGANPTPTPKINAMSFSAPGAAPAFAASPTVF